MAIKPITNENAGYESNVNRAEQTSIRSEKGNPKVVIKKPGGQMYLHKDRRILIQLQVGD